MTVSVPHSAACGDDTAVIDAVVVGAGPVGLTIACALRMHGVAVRVVDVLPAPMVIGSRALGVTPRTVEVLDRLGALGDLPARARSMLKVAVHVRGKYVATFRFGGPVPGGPPGMQGTPQREIEAQLRARLEELGATVEWGSMAEAIRQDAAEVRLQLAGGEKIRAKWLLGCDGAHSTIRKLVNAAFPGEPVVQRLIVADVRSDWTADRDLAHCWVDGDSAFFADALPEAGPDQNLWRFIGSFPLADAGAMSDDDVVELIRQTMRERAGVGDLKIRDVLWTSTFAIHRRLVDSYRHGRVFLLGDAAHIHSPIGGQGMNMGIGDAENLAWKLALVVKGHAHQTLLDTYELERRQFAERTLHGTTRATQLIFTETRRGQLLRDYIVIPLSDRAFVHRRLSLAASQLKLNYRGGPVSFPSKLPRFRKRSLEPGDRVPDMTCTVGDRPPQTRLYAVLGGHWVLLMPYGSLPACAAALEAVLHDELIIATAHTPRGQALLVRPDSHLAWRGDPSSTEPAEWLRRLMGRQLAAV